MAHKVAITDVTNYGSLYCVAGWDLINNKMVRPEPGPASFWSEAFAGPGRPFAPGHVVTFDGESPNGQPFPHATEDLVVDPRTIQNTDTVSVCDLPSFVHRSVSPDICSIFAGSLQVSGFSAYVPTGVGCCSLGAIEIPRAAIDFAEKTYDGKTKLRSHLHFGTSFLNIGITSDALRRL
jgi:hypothetical protein